MNEFFWAANFSERSKNACERMQQHKLAKKRQINFMRILSGAANSVN